ncbi:MAG TPA: succinate dehydrogenase, cytochrome b556 subunit [Sphingomonadales bacterium]|mgnify:CR=1 FL=1
MAQANRPLSPHLQVYRWGFHMVLSILHRGTGIALGVGTLLLAWWLIAAASGQECFEAVQACLGSWFGRLVLFGFTWSLMLHLCNGIRHLIWDTGRGLTIPEVRTSNQLVFWGSVVLTLAAWVLGYSMAGDL